MDMIAPSQFPELLRSSRPLLDVRSELEFVKGSLPNSVCIPLLTGTERATVGTCYKHNGKEAAVALGYQTVSGANRECRIALWSEYARSGVGALYCWRGGLRSKIAQEWLAETGIEVPRVVGGYKALRNYLLEVIRQGASTMSLVMVSGMTGSGKTHLLEALYQRQAAVLDLEHLARHKGSSFGKVFGDQPSQQLFENGLGIAMLRLLDDPFGGPVYVEAESRSIGRVRIPDALFDAMQRCPVVVLESSLEERIANIRRDYVSTLLDVFIAENPERANGELEQFLCGAVRVNSSRLGLELTERIVKCIAQAIADGNSTELHNRWIELMLTQYYDRFYQRHLDGYSDRIIGRGTFDELLEHFTFLRNGK